MHIFNVGDTGIANGVVYKVITINRGRITSLQNMIYGNVITGNWGHGVLEPKDIQEPIPLKEQICNKIKYLDEKFRIKQDLKKHYYHHQKK